MTLSGDTDKDYVNGVFDTWGEGQLSAEMQEEAVDQLDLFAEEYQIDAWAEYMGSSDNINHFLRTGEDRDGVSAQTAGDMAEMFDTGAATQFEGELFRGTSHSAPLQVGQEFGDEGFGSWSANTEEAFNFSLDDASAAGDFMPATMFRMKSSGGVRSVPGSIRERERIMPPGTRVKVVSIREFRPEPGGTGNVHRLVEVEIVEGS